MIDFIKIMYNKMSKIPQNKHIDKALKVQQRILNQVQGLSQDDILLFICAAYNAELAICYQAIEEVK